MVGIDPRYLANIENIGSLPSLPVFYELVRICKLPLERYFFALPETEDSELRQRVSHKLEICQEEFFHKNFPLKICLKTLDNLSSFGYDKSNISKCDEEE